MGQTKSASFRLQVITERQKENLSYAELCRRHQVSYNTIRNICIAFDKNGASSLSPDYSACGRKISNESEKVYRLVRLTKHYHEDWGVPYIRTKIGQKFPQLTLQSTRTYQRRLAKEKPKKAVPPPVIPKIKAEPKVRQPHDEWQIDAKERLVLPDGTQACYLNITDKKSNAILKAKPFPPGQD